jgi:hypothetical protein
MGDYYVLVAKENETIGHMAKELDRGCSPEELIEFNAKNLPCLTSKSKFRAGCEVRLPTLSCAYYLADARVAKAETEAEARVGDAHREMEVAKAEAANAKAEAANAKAEAANAKAEAAAAKAEAKALKGASEQATTSSEATTAAVGSKHQPRRPAEAEVEADVEDEAPNASAMVARLTQLDDAVSKEQAKFSQGRAQIDAVRDGPLASAVALMIPEMESALQKVREELERRDGIKRALLQAQQEHHAATEAEQVVKRRRLSAQTALMAAWHASSV